MIKEVCGRLYSVSVRASSVPVGQIQERRTGVPGASRYEIQFDKCDIIVFNSLYDKAKNKNKHSRIIRLHIDSLNVRCRTAHEKIGPNALFKKNTMSVQKKRFHHNAFVVVIDVTIRFRHYR